MVQWVFTSENCRPLVEPVVAPLRKLIDSGATFTEIKQRLAEIIGNTDTDAFTETLARAGFAARVAGESGAEITEEE